MKSNHEQRCAEMREKWTGRKYPARNTHISFDESGHPACVKCLGPTRKFGHDRYGNQRYACDACPRVFILNKNTRGTYISKEKLATAREAFQSGLGVRATARSAGIHRDTVMKLRDAGVLDEEVVPLPRTVKDWEDTVRNVMGNDEQELMIHTGTILLCCVEYDTLNTAELVRITSYPFSFVRDIVFKIVQVGLWEDGYWMVGDWFDEGGDISFCLHVMMIHGIVVRV